MCKKQISFRKLIDKKGKEFMIGDIIARYWVDFVMGLIAAVLMAKLRSVDKYIGEVDSAKNGVKALLRDRIIDQYNKYSDRGFIPIYARESIAQMYMEYKNLGGNGAIEHLVEKLHDLPTR